jgi:hypothetical protein
MALIPLAQTASNEKLMKLIPDFKFTPFEEALDSSVQWFVQNYDTGALASSDPWNCDPLRLRTARTGNKKA